MATLNEGGMILVSRCVLLYAGWYLLVELSGRGHPEEVEVWTGSDICAVQFSSLDPFYRVVRVLKPTLPTVGESGRASLSKMNTQ